MTYQVPAFDPEAPAIVVDIGNTSISMALWKDNDIMAPLSVAKDDHEGVEELFKECIKAASPRSKPVVAVASVSPASLETIRTFVSETMDRNILVVGDTIPFPIDVGVDDRDKVGVDRICSAAAAYDKIETECVVIDFGTAVTVDVVDESGTFVGGAILPGLDLQLKSLHEYTAALPSVSPCVPSPAYGRNTEEAIQIGVCRGMTGAVRCLIEGYATWLKRWPQVVATGGDLELLMDHCDYIDTAVPHLVLRGVGVSLSNYLEELGV